MLVPCHYKIEVFCGQDFSAEPLRPRYAATMLRRLGPAHVTMRRLPTSITTTTPFETGEAGRLRQAPLMPQRRCTGSWTPTRPWIMDDADAHIYTTTIIMHGEREAKTEYDDHSSLIGGPPAS